MTYKHPPYRCGAWCSHDDEIEAALQASADLPRSLEGLEGLIQRWRERATQIRLRAPSHDDYYDGQRSGQQTELEHCADELEAALRQTAERKSLDWQPIETAPKDKSWLLGWNEDCGCFVWRDGPGLLTGEDPAPTHWMPLPDPPVSSPPAPKGPKERVRAFCARTQGVRCAKDRETVVVTTSYL